MAQVVLVTGAAQGLGRVIAWSFHQAGYRVALSDRSQALAQKTVDELGAGERLLPIKLDVKRKADFEAALSAVVERWGALHVVVNNAAMTQATPLMAITPEEYDEVIAINQRGTFLSCQVFGAHMAQAGYGRIVNLASLAGQNGGTATGAHYASSKGAILTLTKIFARELASANVTVNAIAPGPLELASVRALVPPDKLEKLIDNIPVRRLGDPAFVADMVLQLASPDADFVTGATWDINGGIFMR